MRIRRRKTLSRRRYSSPKGVTGFSDRSGAAFPYSQMTKEPGTGLWVHKSESDGYWNITQAYKDPLVPADAEKLQYGRNVPSAAVAPVEGLFLKVDGTEGASKLFTDNLGQNALETN